jgi:cytosine permease
MHMTTTLATSDDDYPLSEVPARDRRGIVSLTVILFGFTFFTPTMLTGAQVGTAFALPRFVLVVLVGSVLLGTYVGVLAAIGARTGLTSVLLARFALGRRGAKWADLLLGGTQVGWYAVTVAFLADLLAFAMGWEGYEWLIIVVAGAAMGATSYVGYRGMEILSAVSVPLMFLLSFWVVGLSIDRAGGLAELAARVPTESMAVATALTLVVGAFASGGTQVPNWSRFARRTWHGFVAAFAAFLVGHLLMLAFGAIGVLAFGEPDFVDVLFRLDMVAAGVALLVFSLWTTNDNAAYAFGVAGAELFDVPRRRPFIVGGVVIAIALALSGVYAALPQFLTLLGVCIPPLGGVIIGDYLFSWRGRLPHLAEVRFRAVRWGPTVAYVSGVAVAWVTNDLAVGIPPLHGILVALLGVPLADWAFGRLGVDQRHELIPVVTPAAAASTRPREGDGTEHVVVPAGGGRVVRLAAGESVDVVNTHGTQVVDLWAVDAERHLSMEHTRSVNGRIHPRVGDTLFDDRRRGMLRFAGDTSPGVHDTLIAACDPVRYELLGAGPDHANCADNLLDALPSTDHTRRVVPAPLNLFMNVSVSPEGELTFLPPRSQPGDTVTLVALRDLWVIMSACPQDLVPINGRDQRLRPVDVMVHRRVAREAATSA